jgi:Zn-finger nucleic acid-binding protein
MNTSSERQGIEIDYCPQCRGVWLNRGELDKIIERSMATSGGREFEDRPRREHEDSYHYKKKKRESFLGELFDF